MKSNSSGTEYARSCGWSSASASAAAFRKVGRLAQQRLASGCPGGNALEGSDEIANSVIVGDDAEAPAELLQHVDAGPSVWRVHHEVHDPAGREHVAQSAEAPVRIREVVEHAGADDLIEGLAQIAHRALERELVNLEVVEPVLSLELLGVANAGGAEVDAGHPRRRPAQACFAACEVPQPAMKMEWSSR